MLRQAGRFSRLLNYYTFKTVSLPSHCSAQLCRAQNLLYKCIAIVSSAVAQMCSRVQIWSGWEKLRNCAALFGIGCTAERFVCGVGRAFALFSLFCRNLIQLCGESYMMSSCGVCSYQVSESLNLIVESCNIL